MPFFFTNRDNVDYLFLLEIFFGGGIFDPISLWIINSYSFSSRGDVICLKLS